MRIKNLFTTATLLLASATAFADPYHHPETGDLVFDTDSVEFSNDCLSSEVSFNDGSLDVVYKGVEAVAGSSRTCQMKIDINVPDGWLVYIYTESAVTGNYIAPALASFEHTVAGTSRQAAFKYFPEGAGSYMLDQELEEIGFSTCGESMRLKTVANVVALGAGTYVSAVSGSLNGETLAWRYHFLWERC